MGEVHETLFICHPNCIALYASDCGTFLLRMCVLLKEMFCRPTPHWFPYYTFAIFLPRLLHYQSYQNWYKHLSLIKIQSCLFGVQDIVDGNNKLC